MQIKTNYKVLIPILAVVITAVISVFFLTDINYASKAIITIVISIAGGKTYSSFCNFEGKLRYKMAKESD